MAKRIIDLRHQDVPLPTLPDVKRMERAGQRPESAALASERTIGSGTLKHRNTGEGIVPSTSGNFGSGTIEWTALEYPMRERGPYWWLPPSAAALACVLFGILVNSYFFAVFAGISLLVVLLYARRPPRAYRFVISREGVYIGETRHRFSELKSFWIFEHEQGSELSLETASGKIFPYLSLPLGDVHPNRIRRVVSDFLPEREHQELFTDQIARSIGF